MDEIISYATIDDLRALFTGAIAFPESKAEELQKQLETASEYLRVRFSLLGRDIDSELASGALSSIIVSDIVANVVKRSFVASVSTTSGMEFSQFSQSAGGYAFSGSPVSSGSGFYLRKDELRLLGIGQRRARLNKMF